MISRVTGLLVRTTPLCASMKRARASVSFPDPPLWEGATVALLVKW
jgi:hypothetical protein